MCQLAVVMFLIGILTTPAVRADEAAAKEKCKACGSQSQHQQDSGDYSAPYFCPLWDMLTMADGDLYYCEYFERDDCSDEPSVTYVVGQYGFPCTCDASGHGCCVSAWHGAKSYPGLRTPVPADYMHSMPAGKSREFSRVLIDPSLDYIKCTVNGRQIFAKVFAVATDVKGAQDGIPSGSYDRTVYLAFETRGSSNTAPTVAVTPVGLANEGVNYVFRATYSPAPNRTIPILLLVAR